MKKKFLKWSKNIILSVFLAAVNEYLVQIDSTEWSLYSYCVLWEKYIKKVETASWRKGIETKD